MSGIIRSTVSEVDEIAMQFVDHLSESGVDKATISEFVDSAAELRASADADGEIVSRPSGKPAAAQSSWCKKFPTSPV